MREPNNLREAEEGLEATENGAPAQQGSALEAWYLEVRNTPFDQLSDWDVARSLRQGLAIEWLVPPAIRRAAVDPTAGDHMECELLVALGSVPREFWLGHASLLAEFVRVLEAAVESLHGTGAVVAELERIRDRAVGVA